MLALAGYSISKQLYRNAKTIVYRAIREWDKLSVIIKILNAEYPTTQQLTRLKYEYEITQKINDLSGIMKSYGIEPYNNNNLALILEDVGGQSLKEFITTQQRLDVPTILTLAIKLAETLGELHQRQIIHKDIKPDNLIYNYHTGQIKFTDFSISTLGDDDIVNLDTTLFLEGTLAYMSPEQTGRMNRKVDYRSDFYSLGITLYEIFTGQLPFNSDDPLELIHCHLAKLATSPHLLNPAVPVPVAGIVMKLLEKNAEHRYQSAYGLKADLQICLHQLQTTHQVKSFSYGQYDIGKKLQVPQKLYGRDLEIQTLLKTFELVTQGPPQVALISGAAGEGKTALVHEIYRPLTAKRGYFISGKFDQLQHNIPYSALIKAFQELSKQLLMAPAATLRNWRNRLLATLGINAQVIISVIPEMEIILGPQPPVPELPPAQAQNRFHLVFHNFVNVFAKPEHPLVLFLDDLQWADTASLKLLQQLLTTQESLALFFIGAYRDNEINAAHPFHFTLQAIQSAGTSIQRLQLSPLDLPSVTQLLSETLNSSPTHLQPLAELVFNKTQGNPFFINEFVKKLYAEGFLYWKSPVTTVTVDQSEQNEKKEQSEVSSMLPQDLRLFQATWHWELAKIQAREITDNVVELLTSTLQKFSQATQQLLQLAACLGNRFQLLTLKQVSGKSSRELMQLLQNVVTQGILCPLSGENFQFSVFCSSVLSTLEPSQLTVEYKFAHDRLQQAAYSLIPNEQRPQWHHQIGQRLLQTTPVERQEETLFSIVHQLNLGREQLTEFKPQEKLARLNLKAGHKAKAAAAYESASRYFKVGLELLGADGWQSHYDLTLQLTVEIAEIAYLMGEFAEMTALTETVLQQATSLLDQIKAYEIQMQAYKAQNRPQAAVHLGLAVLKELGLTFPKNPKKIHRLWGEKTTHFALLGQSQEQLLQLPPMTDAYQLAAMRIMLSISPAVYAIKPQLLPLITFKRIKLSLHYGNAYESAPAYASYGYILCAIAGKIDRGVEFGQLALRLLEQQKSPELTARVWQIVYGVITHYKAHLRTTLKPLQEAYRCGLDTGNFEYAALSATTYAGHAYFVGHELTTLEREIAAYSDSFLQLKQEASLPLNRVYQQAILNLRGYSQQPMLLIGEMYDETQQLPLHQKAGARGLLFQVYVQKLMLCYWFQDYTAAFNHSLLAKEYLDAVIGSTIVPLFHFYDSLAKLAIISQAKRSDQEKILSTIIANQKQMQQWATHAPMNYLHKFYLVEAERARFAGQNSQAREYYEQAITLAQRYEYLQEEALANELTARFYLAKQQYKLAQVYLREAHYAYSRWGAVAKVKALENQYPFLTFLHPTTQPNEFTKFSWLPVPATIPPTTTMTIQGSPRELDLATVFKASQVFVGEIVLHRLLEKLMRIVMENVGADNVFLLLEQNGQWIIQAKSHLNNPTVELTQSTLEQDNSEVSFNIIHYVARTKEYVVLNEASQQAGNFTNDPHLQKSKPKSVLCIPLVNQGNLSGILYLENNLVAGAFTPNRLELLYLLSSQMAISLENAQLYAELEEKVKNRTKDLAAQNAKLIILNEKLVNLNQDKNEFLGIAAHDLKNPLSAIQGLAEMIVRDFEELSKDDVLELAQMISISSQQMFELIKNLLDVNRIESGKLNLSLAIFNLLPILKEVVNDYRERAKTKNLKLILEVAEEKYLIFADEQTVRQVLDNLISNALKYSPPGKAIYVKIIKIDKRIRCEVIDQGPGLTPEDQQKLFGKFTRLTPQPTGNENSTGLGLFIVKKLVETMYAKVWCHSQIGQGSTFTVEFRTNAP